MSSTPKCANYTNLFLNFSWQKVSAFLKSPTATVHGLDVGKEYEFRVMAENVMGVSESLQTTAAIKAKHPYGMHIFIKPSASFNTEHK